MQWLFSHKHIAYLKTIELVISTLIKRRVDASQIAKKKLKLLQFHIAYTKVDKKWSLTEHNKLLDMLDELTTEEFTARNRVEFMKLQALWLSYNPSLNITAWICNHYKHFKHHKCSKYSTFQEFK